MAKYPKIVSVFIGTFLVLALNTVIFAQSANVSSVKPEPQKIDEFGRVGESDLRARIDNLLIELRENPDHQGYIINYLPADTRPADLNIYPREEMIGNHLSFRREFHDGPRITVLRGGLRQDVSTELWLIPPGAEPPMPSNTLAEPPIRSAGTFIYSQRYLNWAGESQLPGYFLAGSFEETDVSDAEPELEQISNDDERALLEKLDVDISSIFEQRKSDRFVIYYYADGQYYDIGKLHMLMEKSRLRFLESNNISPERVRLEFGGYRKWVEVEIIGIPEIEASSN